MTIEKLEAAVRRLLREKSADDFDDEDELDLQPPGLVRKPLPYVADDAAARAGAARLVVPAGVLGTALVLVLAWSRVPHGPESGMLVSPPGDSVSVTRTSILPPSPPTPDSIEWDVGATAQCRDGWFSHSRHRSGTCSGHHGVAVWRYPATDPFWE